MKRQQRYVLVVLDEASIWECPNVNRWWDQSIKIKDGLLLPESGKGQMAAAETYKRKYGCETIFYC